MKRRSYKFSSSIVSYLQGNFSELGKLVDKKNAIIITDENVFEFHKQRFRGWNTMVLKAGEETKTQSTVDAVVRQLIDAEADRTTTLIGVGGGVITDLTGYIASVYLRGVPFGFVPTTVLAMVDASIGGKNGIDVGLYKNMVGVIRQPGFLLYDMNFLASLPQPEWINGFAEVIKHACIKDATMFRELESRSVKEFSKDPKQMGKIITRNAEIKSRIVQRDEFEKGERRLLNFGHTLGHALENQYELSHGQAVAIGMTYASVISEKITGFKEAPRIAKLLLKYDLPTFMEFELEETLNVMKSDKKRTGAVINYVLLEKIGKAVTKPIPIKKLKDILIAL